MDLARLVGEEPALPGGAHLVGHGRDGVRADRAIHLFARSIGEGVAALAAAGQVVVDGPLAAALRCAPSMAKSAVKPTSGWLLA